LRADASGLKSRKFPAFEIGREAPDLMQSVVSLPLKTNDLRAFRVADFIDFPFR
jgi:hypothetical protein